MVFVAIWLKPTVLSPLPYAVSFGLIPAFVTYGLTPPEPPALWLTAAAALSMAGWTTARAFCAPACLRG